MLLFFRRSMPMMMPDAAVIATARSDDTMPFVAATDYLMLCFSGDDCRRAYAKMILPSFTAKRAMLCQRSDDAKRRYSASAMKSSACHFCLRDYRCRCRHWRLERFDELR